MARPIKIKWDMFYDESFYDLWAVRPMGDTDFNSPRLFHFDSRLDAEKFIKLLDRAWIAEVVGDNKI